MALANQKTILGYSKDELLVIAAGRRVGKSMIGHMIYSCLADGSSQLAKRDFYATIPAKRKPPVYKTQSFQPNYSSSSVLTLDKIAW